MNNNHCSGAMMGQVGMTVRRANGAKLYPYPPLHECASWEIIHYLSCPMLWVMMVPVPEEECSCTKPAPSHTV